MALLNEASRVFGPKTLDALTSLTDLGLTDSFYLAGSAALSSHLGHRPQLDSLDFMSESNHLRSASRRELLGGLLSFDSDLEVETARDGYLFCRTAGGSGLRFFYYPYPLIAASETIAGCAVASLVDLGLMKLGAIISRGRRADFVDMYVLCQRLPLVDLLAVAPSKFERVRDFPLQALKGLADLSLAIDDQDPTLTKPLSWSKVVEWIESDVSSLARHELRLERRNECSTS